MIKPVLIGMMIASMIAEQAHALSCVRPEPAVTFTRLKDVPESYYVMHGTLTFNQSQMPEGVVNQRRTPLPVRATFTGKGLTNDGFNAALNRTITIQPICLGPWCGSLETGQDYLVFAKVVSNDIVLEVGPCGGSAFPNPTRATLDEMTVCMNVGACAP